MRTPRLPLLLLLALTPLLGGCGGAAGGEGGDGVTNAHATYTLDRHLDVYSSLPLGGPPTSAGSAARQIADGERLALADAHGRAGRFRVGLVSLDDSGPEGRWQPDIVATNARAAARDKHTVAYVGDYDSGATAVSLPITNQAGILQISPRSPYVGLTSSYDAGQGDPERFYLTGKRNFVRLLPGDPVQGAAQVALMRRLGVRSVYVLGDGEPFNSPLASIVAEDAKAAGIEVLGEQTVEVAEATPETSFVGVVEAVIESGAGAVFLSAQASEGAALLWRQLHAADRRLSLLGSSELAEPPFTETVGAAAGRTYLTSPVLPASLYPPAARRVLAQFHRRYAAAPTANVLYGYAAMRMVLDAIESAGPAPEERKAVIAAAFATHRHDSAIGRFSVLGDGETTIARYGVYRIRHGRPAFWRALRLHGPHVP